MKLRKQLRWWPSSNSNAVKVKGTVGIESFALLPLLPLPLLLLRSVFIIITFPITVPTSREFTALSISAYAYLIFLLASLAMQRLSPSEQSEIIQLCELHEEKHRFDPYYRRCLVLRSWFIKYGGHADLEFEYKTQEYLWNMTNGQQNAPRIPQIIDYFSPKEEWAYLVTERIDPIQPANTSPRAVATAIQWLRSVPRPSGLTLGSVGGGSARHKLFKNFEAPLSFSSAKGLQKYMNLVYFCSCFSLTNWSR